jgi:hypothetical protein
MAEKDEREFAFSQRCPDSGRGSWVIDFGGKAANASIGSCAGIFDYFCPNIKHCCGSVAEDAHAAGKK